MGRENRARRHRETLQGLNGGQPEAPPPPDGSSSEVTGAERILEGTPYRSLRRLGAGGMGDLFAAVDRISGESVVVKVLRRELVAQPDSHERMRVEGEAIGLLSHPHIVAGRGLGVTGDGRPYVAMERLKGHSLRVEGRRRGPLPLAEAIRHTRQLLSALRAVHAAGVVHRDVKPDNVMLCAGGGGAEPRIKLIDFGIAKVIRVDRAERAAGVRGTAGPRIAPLAIPTLEGICVGTPRYVSPEQASGAEIDPRTDVYATGIFLYTLVAGRGPFDELKGAGELLRAHRELAPPPPSRVAGIPIPALLEEVILRAISKNPGDRFGSALAFSHELWRTVSRLSHHALRPPGGRFQVALVPTAAGPLGGLPVAFGRRPTVVALAAVPEGGAPSVEGPGPTKVPVPTPRRRRCRPGRRRRWIHDASLVLGAAAFGALAGALSIWLMP